MPDQIIIEFVADTSQLQPAEDRLADLGKIDAQSAVIFKKTNDEIKSRSQIFQQMAADANTVSVSVSKQQEVYNKLVSSLGNLSGQAKDAVQQLLKMSASDVAKGFDQAGVSVDDYVKALSDAGTTSQVTTGKTTALRTELLNITNQLAQLKLNGQGNSAQFADLATKAGVLREALQENRTVVQNLSKGTPLLTAFGAGLQGITGAFSAAQGASALFGNDQKDLQEVLVKVNGAMAISQGIQSALQGIRESAALSTVQLVIAEKIYNAEIAIENGLQSESAIARGVATVAQYALNLAMSLNPIGIVVVALAGYIAALYAFANASKVAAEATGALDAVVSSATTDFEAFSDGVKRSAELAVSELQKVGARQSDIDKENLSSFKQIQQARAQEILNLSKLISQNQDSTNEDVQAKVKEANTTLQKIQKDFDQANVDGKVQSNALQKKLIEENLQDNADAIEARLALAKKNSDQEFDLEKQLLKAKAAIDIEAAGQNASKVADIQNNLAKSLLAVEEQREQVHQNNLIAIKTTALIKLQNQTRAIDNQISDEEVKRQNDIINKQAQFEATRLGISAAQATQIRAAAAQKISENNQAQVARDVQYAEEKEIELNKVILDQVNISDKQRAQLNIENIQSQAAIELAQVGITEDKKKQIVADREAAINTVKLNLIKKELSDELALNDVNNADFVRTAKRNLDIQSQIASAGTEAEKKEIEKITGIRRESLAQQLADIDQLTQISLQDVHLREDALTEELEQGVISQNDFVIQYKQLKDEEVKINEDGEDQKQKKQKQTYDLAKAKQQAIIDAVGQFAQQGVDIIAGIFKNQDDARQQQIDAEKQNIQDLSDAGAITAKEASNRNKKLDAEQRQLQIQQAKRDKEIALFNAIVSTAEAVAKALTAGPISGEILAGITAALGAAQIAVIASRPLPKFWTGKKNKYEGFGEVGDRGAELIQKDGQMYVAKTPTITWLGKDDIVYNAKETIDLMSKPSMTSFKGDTISTANNLSIDYKKLGKSVADSIANNIPQQGLDINEKGFTEWVKKGNAKTIYLDKRRSWKK